MDALIPMDDVRADQRSSVIPVRDEEGSVLTLGPGSMTRARGPAALCLVVLLLVSSPGLVAAGAALDPRDAALSPAWLIFGFAAQAVFGLRFLVQWIASERARDSVVPPGFWVLSLVGGVALFIYFMRRGDPVGMLGQGFGLVVYARNLYLLSRRRRRPTQEAAAIAPGFERRAPNI